MLAPMDKKLAGIPRRDKTVDWQCKENVRAKELRLKIKTLILNTAAVAKVYFCKRTRFHVATLDLIIL